MNKVGLLAGVMIFCGGVVVGGPAMAQKTLSPAQLEAIVKPSLNSCSSGKGSVTNGKAASQVAETATDPTRVIPTINAREIPQIRVARTLNGVWRGEVVGDKGEVHVDYFWIIDTARNEALIIAQRSGEQTVTGTPEVANPPKLTYVMCSHDGYSPSTNTPQIHQFVKISNSTDNAAKLIEKATGLKSTTAHPTLETLWNRLIASGYFDGLPYVAFAGGFFKPLQVGLVQTKVGPPQVSINWRSEYRGGGSTKLKYTTGVPIVGSERAQFVGTSSISGDYLVASPGNGKLWKVEAWPATDIAASKARTSKVTGEAATGTTSSAVNMLMEGDYALAFDSVTLGPIQ